MQTIKGLNIEGLKEKCETIGELVVTVNHYRTLLKNNEACICLKLTTKEQGDFERSPCNNFNNFAEALVDDL